MCERIMKIVLFFFCWFLVVDGSWRCDFESTCEDFLLDQSWGWTDGMHPVLIERDHTLNSSAGHYIFYQPTSSSEIKCSSWLTPERDRAVCFNLWYFTTDGNFSFTVEVVQGEDEQMSRIIADRNRSMDDWTGMKVVLPVERMKLSIRVNSTETKHLVFDDLTIDVCDDPRPPVPQVLFSCDFESACSDSFLSLPFYPYQWQVIQAGQPPIFTGNPPAFDFTYGNRSGHYAWVNNWRQSEPGRVGYLATRQTFHIQANQSYCLNFEYFRYGVENTSQLRVFVRMADPPEAIQQIWPRENAYQYSINCWSWAIINLPLGDYSLLFRLETSPIFSSSFVLDNIDILSCDYPSWTLSANDTSFLSFLCDFDDFSSCGMINHADPASPPSYNFSVYSGETVPKPQLGPTRDHTTNTTGGAFLYWNQQLPFVPAATGWIYLGRTIEQTSGTCLQFAYYAKSSLVNRNATTLNLFASDNATRPLWTQSLDDSQGWQLVTLAFPRMIIQRAFYFTVKQSILADVSVAFDDISVEQCPSLPFTTTTTVTTTTSTTITSTRTTTTTAPTTTTTTSTVTTSSTTQLITTTSTSTTTSSTQSSTTVPTGRAQSTSLTTMMSPLLIIMLCISSPLFFLF